MNAYQGFSFLELHKIIIRYIYKVARQFCIKGSFQGLISNKRNLLMALLL